MNTPSFHTVGIVGTGAMGRGIAQIAAQAGSTVLLFDGHPFGLIDTHWWGTLRIYLAAVLTIWWMVYYLQKALPEIRAKAR